MKMELTVMEEMGEVRALMASGAVLEDLITEAALHFDALRPDLEAARGYTGPMADALRREAWGLLAYIARLRGMRVTPVNTEQIRGQPMKNETGITIAKTYYGVQETGTGGDGDTLELIHGVYQAMPEDTEVFTGSADIFTRWYETEAQAQDYYAERRREFFPDEDEDDEDYLARYASLQADAEVKHAIEHGYADFGAW